MGSPPSGSGSPTSPEGSKEPRGLTQLAAKHGRKAIVAVLLAFAAGIALAVKDWASDLGQETATHVIESLSGAPIEVRVLATGAFVSGHPFAPYYVIPRDRVAGPQAVGRSTLARMAKQEGFLDVAWAEGHGGQPGSPQIVRLQLSGKREQTVTITGIRTRVVRKSAPVKGWYIASPGCGTQPVRVATVDLDTPRPIKGFFDEGGRRRHLALTVTKTDHEQLELHASTRQSAVEWKVVISYSAGDGGTRSVVVPEGEPFRVTSELASEGYRPDFTGGVPSVTREHHWDRAGITAC